MGSSDSRPAPPGNVAPNSVRAEIDTDHVQKLNHTRRFEDLDEYVVLRRGETFPLTLHSQTHLTVEGAKLTRSSGESVDVEVSSHRSRRTGTVVNLTTLSNSAIGVFELSVRGKFEDGEAFEVKLKRKAVVLFNAWNKEDGVYLEDDDQREEYVENSDGRLYAGSHIGMPWKLGLYRPDSLRAVLYMLDNLSELTFDQLRSPALVAREMSALVNVQGENGVLVGRWDGEYADGHSPNHWRGSGDILHRFYQSGGQPVRYGQCWVFSGVLLAVLRILGIPSRSVTNFNSAHDTNRNRTIDQYYDSEGEKVYYLSSGSDSIWNFHVWNEVWMTRPDLPKGFDGWQAVDATPQEESPQGGGYRTGPSPIKAIKEGNSVVYDTNFIIAEVNADIKKYAIGEDGAPRLFQVDTNTVGKTISTKAVGSNHRHDLTDEYKHPEGSDWERRALYSGYKELLEEIHDVDFEIPMAKYGFGQDITFEVKATNKAKQHHIKGTILCEAVTYTGRVLGGEPVKKERVNIKVKKGATVPVKMHIDGKVFTDYPGTKVYLRFTVTLAVIGTAQIFSETVQVSPEPPELQIEAPQQLAVGHEATILVRFENPLPVAMKDVTITVESDELLHEDILDTIGTVGPNAEVSYSFKVTGLKLGKSQLVVGLDSDKVELVTGETEVEIVERVTEEIDATPSPVLPMEIEDLDTNLEENRTAHHTSDYDDSGLITRRGQPFTLILTAKEELPKQAKIISRATFTLISTSTHRPYTFEVDSVATNIKGKTINLDIRPPADAAVGRYSVLLTLEYKGKVTVVHQKVVLILLFNPWCIEDTCHYPQTSDLEEYVLNNRGRIWVGSARNNYGRPWQFAQFKKESLEVALWVLDKMPANDRTDAVKVSRHISAWVNVQDDNGVLIGNWSGDYEGGNSPLAWVGSGDILAEYNRTHTGVKYGQCWVFSGVQTTVLRCVGLPARSISNFNSAHDTHFNRAIDKYFDEEGKQMDTGDSIWNFHVWNEAWMARPDLPNGFGGWQALDATPQEESPQGGGYRLGPCPVQAVKFGQRMNFDVEFVISEVNADIRYYTVHEDDTVELTRVNTDHVGKNISTKAVGSDAREDVTLKYKFSEGSTSERATLLADTEGERAIGLELSIDENITIGQDFYVRAIVTNKTNENKEFRLQLRGNAMLYTGAPGQSVKSNSWTMTLNAGESQQYELHVMPVDYLRILEGGNFIHFVAMAFLPADKLSVIRTEEFRLKTPDIIVTLPEGGLKLHVAATIRVELKNPLSKRLTNAKFFLHGESHLQDTTVSIPPVSPYGTAMAELMTIPIKRGKFDLIVRFTSDQLTDILGDQECEVV